MTIIEKMERGQFAVNIPTSLALESLIGIHPERTWDSPPHLKYDQIWVNLKTLVRNIMSSFPKDVVDSVRPNFLTELIQDEWNAVKGVIYDHTKLEPVLYMSNYADLERRYNKQHALVRRDNTEKQKEMTDRTNKAIASALKEWTKDDIRIFKTDVEGDKDRNAIMMTHLPYDLVHHNTFGDLDLLESHTGMIKNRSLWYTKFLGGKDLAMIPFTLYFLRIFGDKEMFAPMDIKLRKELIELGTKFKWNALTTDSRVRTNIEYLQNPYYKAILRDIINTR